MKRFSLACGLVLALGLLALTGCEKKQEGNMESVGEQADEATENATTQAEGAMEGANKAMEGAGN